MVSARILNNLIIIISQFSSFSLNAMNHIFIFNMNARILNIRDSVKAHIFNNIFKVKAFSYYFIIIINKSQKLIYKKTQLTI